MIFQAALTSSANHMFAVLRKNAFLRLFETIGLVHFAYLITVILNFFFYLRREIIFNFNMIGTYNLQIVG